ncbi:hypothetical protein HGA64_01680 [Candidatus Falkowbacteria bacterium]|nr:hypothetical protein [Candidatus Falkowbacteria bacterium]
MEQDGCVMQETEPGDIRLAAFFLDEALCQLTPHFQGELIIRYQYRMRAITGLEEVMAIIERTPNPEFGKPPCCFEKPVITLNKGHGKAPFILRIDNQLYLNVGLKKILK